MSPRFERLQSVRALRGISLALDWIPRRRGNAALPYLGRADLPVRRNFAADERSKAGGSGGHKLQLITGVHAPDPDMAAQSWSGGKRPKAPATSGPAGCPDAPGNLAGARLDSTAARQRRPTVTVLWWGGPAGRPRARFHKCRVDTRRASLHKHDRSETLRPSRKWGGRGPERELQLRLGRMNNE
jgi:hypothetical protein